ncbi:MAG: TetR/AcrR family transcriptional regulator [Thaumarchaeota archaeon]|nr:TetR/AcrR family transcriptional regulator [Nitrososphaerota archaeon]
MPRSEEANQVVRGEARDRILLAARRVFARRGPAATMSEVAQDAGISQGLAYRYFESKEEILATLVKQAAESGGGLSSRIERIRGTPGERLYVLVSSILEARRREPEFYQLIYQALADYKTPNDLREVMRKSGEAMEAEMKKLIVEGQATGEMAKDDPNQLLGAVLACLDGLSRAMLTLGPKEARASIPDASVVMRMLRPDPREASAR